MKIRFERILAAPPSVAWGYLTNPDDMNLWSEAKVRALRPGANGRHDDVGATRTVTVPAFGFTSTLDEEVVESVLHERFGYRVVRGGALRDHRGEQRLAPHRDGTALVWEVRFEAAIPGLAPLLKGILEPRLARSLDALVTLVARRPSRGAGA